MVLKLDQKLNIQIWPENGYTHQFLKRKLYLGH